MDCRLDLASRFKPGLVGAQKRLPLVAGDPDGPVSQNLANQVLRAFKSTSKQSAPRRSPPAPDHTAVGVVVDQVDHSRALQVGTGLGKRLGLCSEKLHFFWEDLYKESDRRICRKSCNITYPYSYLQMVEVHHMDFEPCSVWSSVIFLKRKHRDSSENMFTGKTGRLVGSSNLQYKQNQ